MMRLSIYHFLLIGVILLGSCKPKRVTPEALSLGSYVGMSPCSNCRGVYTHIIFQSDGIVRMSSEVDDPEALRGRSGYWKMGNDHIIRVGIGRDSLYFRMVSSESIMSVYQDRQNPEQLKDGYLLRKDTVRQE